jgi:hypothetical protein
VYVAKDEMREIGKSGESRVLMCRRIGGVFRRIAKTENFWVR